MQNRFFSVTVRDEDSGSALHLEHLSATGPMLAIHVADRIPLADWTAGPAPAEAAEAAEAADSSPAPEHFSSDGYPITVGAKFWDNDLRVCEISEVAAHSNAYSDTGCTQTWHGVTSGGQFDTLDGAMSPYGRLTRFYPHEPQAGSVSAELHPVGTRYHDVKHR